MVSKSKLRIGIIEAQATARAYGEKVALSGAEVGRPCGHVFPLAITHSKRSAKSTNLL